MYVEKPLGTSIGEGRAAVQAARKYDRVVQIGTQQRSWPHYQQAAEVIRSGRLGEISEVKVWDYDYMYPGFGSPPDSAPPPEFGEAYWDFWLGPSPKRPYNPNRFLHHYWFFDYAGGWQVDWAVHHNDIVHMCLGVTAPFSATASGGFLCFEKTNTEWPDTFSGICEYGPGPVAKKGFLLQYTFRGGCRREQRSHGKLFCGTEASLILDRSGYTITPDIGKKGRKRPSATHFGVNRCTSRAWRLTRRCSWTASATTAVARRRRAGSLRHQPGPSDEHRLEGRPQNSLGRGERGGHRRPRGQCSGHQAVPCTVEPGNLIATVCPPGPLGQR